MPEMDGCMKRQADSCKQPSEAKDVIIVAMTANAFYEDELEALKNGMNLHMSKPIEPEIIFAALQKFCMIRRVGEFNERQGEEVHE